MAICCGSTVAMPALIAARHRGIISQCVDVEVGEILFHVTNPFKGVATTESIDDAFLFCWQHKEILQFPERK